jgi:hypothetical protein
MKRGICTSCLDQCQGKSDAAQIACRRIGAAAGWFDVEAQAWREWSLHSGPFSVWPPSAAVRRWQAPRCVAIRTLHGVAQGIGGARVDSACDVGRNATAEWRHLCDGRG